MNKGSHRGDAYGFYLDILPKLKDVKSKVKMDLYAFRISICSRAHNNQYYKIVVFDQITIISK